MRLKLENTNSQRFRLALERLKQGDGFDFHEINFSADYANGILQVAAYSSWQMKNISKVTAFSDIQRGIEALRFLKNASTDFAATVERLKSPLFATLRLRAWCG